MRTFLKNRSAVVAHLDLHTHRIINTILSTCTETVISTYVVVLKFHVPEHSTSCFVPRAYEYSYYKVPYNFAHDPLKEKRHRRPEAAVSGNQPIQAAKYYDENGKHSDFGDWEVCSCASQQQQCRPRGRESRRVGGWMLLKG